MKSQSLRKLCLSLSLSALAAFGLYACGDDSSDSKQGDSKQDESAQCTQAKKDECSQQGKVCEKGKCVSNGNEEDKCTQAKKDECTQQGKLCDNGECVSSGNEDDQCTEAKIAECAQTDRLCKDGNCIPKEDKCTQEKIEECDRLQKICDDGNCVDQAILSVIPGTQIALLSYKTSLDEQDIQTPKYKLCYQLDFQPSGDVTLSISKDGEASNFIGIDKESLTLNASNYNAEDNCIEVSDLNDGTPGKSNLGDRATITAKTSSSEKIFNDLTVDSSIVLKDNYEYGIQLAYDGSALHEESEPDFSIYVRLQAAPADGQIVKINTEVECPIAEIHYKGISTPHMDDNINNVFTTDPSTIWNGQKSYNFQLKDNPSINQEGTCKIKFKAETDDPNYKDLTRAIELTITEDDH